MPRHEKWRLQAVIKQRKPILYIRRPPQPIVFYKISGGIVGFTISYMRVSKRQSTPHFSLGKHMNMVAVLKRMTICCIFRNAPQLFQA